jgi:hypothetical protein
MAGAFAATASSASAAGVTASGTIVYDKDGNVWQTTPDGATVHQVTSNGATPTANGTGSTGYTVPSESDAGLIVAVRNQDYGSYSQGFLWVMDRNGTVLSAFKPPQFNLLPQFAGCPGPQAQFPTGILNATVSPDGKHVAYTATAIGNAPDCEAISEVGSWVVDIDGTNGHWLSADPYGTADVEIGRWVSNTRLLIDRFDFGSIQNFYVDLPGYTAHAWMAPGDYIDQAYLQPDVANGVLVTDGYSETSSDPVIRVWPTSGYSSVPSDFCEYPSVANPGVLHDNLNQPSLSPDGSYVVFEDYDATAPDAADEGLYLAPAAAALASTQACAAATASLFVQGAADPFWTPASITQLPPDTQAPTVSLTAPTSVATVGSSTHVTWSGHDDYSGVQDYQLRYRRAPYSGGFGAWTYPASWQHLTVKSVTATGLAAGYDYCYSVRALDNAGNPSAWTAARCTAVPLDDRSLTHPSAWHQVSGAHYYDQTATTTKTLHATLSRANASLDRVGVLATTCVGCGKVGVYVSGQLVGTVNLASSATHYRVLTMLARFSLRTGTVTLKVLTSGKAVTVDGLLISRS